jgi:hypothetical protein
MGEIIFTVKAKLAWQDAMAFDHALTPMAFRVGYAIGWHVNKETCIAIVAMETLAAKLGCSLRTIWSAVDLLERRGHLKVHRREIGTRKKDGRVVCGGRVAHRYEPQFRTQSAASFPGGGQGERTQSAASLPAPQRTQNSASKDANSGELGRSRLRPYPLHYPFQYPSQSADGAMIVACKRSELGTFEQELAIRLGIDHAKLIEIIDEKTLHSLHRLHRFGNDITDRVDSLRLKLAGARGNS